jgi:hypothetical protein
VLDADQQLQQHQREPHDADERKKSKLGVDGQKFQVAILYCPKKVIQLNEKHNRSETSNKRGIFKTPSQSVSELVAQIRALQPIVDDIRGAKVKSESSWTLSGRRRHTPAALTV